MAIIVESKKNFKRYILLGTGYGLYKTVSPSFFGGSLLPDEENGNMKVLTLADDLGNIEYYDAAEFRVIRIDGHDIAEFKNELKSEHFNENRLCPGCNSIVSDSEIECHECGLRLK